MIIIIPIGIMLLFLLFPIPVRRQRDSRATAGRRGEEGWRTGNGGTG